MIVDTVEAVHQVASGFETLDSTAVQVGYRGCAPIAACGSGYKTVAAAEL